MQTKKGLKELGLNKMQRQWNLQMKFDKDCIFIGWCIALLCFFFFFYRRSYLLRALCVFSWSIILYVFLSIAATSRPWKIVGRVPPSRLPWNCARVCRGRWQWWSLHCRELGRGVYLLGCSWKRKIKMEWFSNKGEWK